MKNDKRGTGNGHSAQGALAAAAIGVETEMQQIADLSAALEKLPLDSHKNLQKASEMVTRVHESQTRFVSHMGALLTAASAVRDSHDAAATSVKVRIDAIGERAQVFQVLSSRYARIGEATHAVNELIKVVAEKKKLLSEGAAPDELAAKLGDVATQLETLVSEADAITRDANAEHFVDIARETDALRQALRSAQNRLGALQRTLVG